MYFELKPIEALRSAELPQVAEPFYAQYWLHNAQSGYCRIRGFHDLWESCIHELDPHRDHWNHRAHGFQHLLAKIKLGHWVLVLDPSWPPASPAFEKVNGHWEPTPHLRDPSARQRLETRLKTLQHEQREAEILQSQNRPATPKEIEPASGPGTRVGTLGPHVGGGENTNPAKSSDPIALRVDQNMMLRSSPQFANDMKKVGVTDTQIARMWAKEAPLGFESVEQFTQFKSELDVALKSAGLKDAEIGLKGTSTTFYSENPGKPLGHHWDAVPSAPGDYDLNITSQAMVKKLQNVGVTPSEKYGVFKTKDIEKNFPQLNSFQENWSRVLGRDVNFVGYPKPVTRDATEYVLRGVK